MQAGASAQPTSIVLKAAMAVSGFGMALWLTLHMLGNLGVFLGPEVLNGYALKLRATGLVWPMRVVMLGLLGVHVACAVWTTRRGLAARPERYRVILRGRASSWGSRTMRVGGALLLMYVVYHVAQLYGLGQPDYRSGDVYHNVLGVLANPLHAVIYLVATFVAALHLAHGLGSALISLGIVPGRRQRQIRAALRAWVWILTVGFSVEVFAPVLLG